MSIQNPHGHIFAAGKVKYEDAHRRFPKGDRRLRLFSCPLVASAEAIPTAWFPGGMKKQKTKKQHELLIYYAPFAAKSQGKTPITAIPRAQKSPYAGKFRPFTVPFAGEA